MTVTNRLQKLRQNLTEKELDGCFVSQPENRYYLSGFNGSAGYLLITAQNTVLATDSRYTEQAKMQAPGYRIFPIAGNMADWLPRLLDGLKLNRLGFEAGHLTLSFYQQLSDILKTAQPRIQLVALTNLVESLRAVKEPEEIELITKAAEISDRALEYIQGTIRPGMTEEQVAWDIEKFMREHSSQSLPFEVIVASGPNAALPHAKPSPRRISAGEAIVIDIGARFDGYASDLSRTLCLGAGDNTFSKIYNTVFDAQRTAIELIKEGMSGDEADRLARKVIETAGYGGAFGHGLGHGIGLAVHEEPRLGPNSNETLTSGMVFSVEPGIYLTGWGGVRIEDLVVLENGKTRVLSRASKRSG